MDPAQKRQSLLGVQGIQRLDMDSSLLWLHLLLTDFLHQNFAPVPYKISKNHAICPC